jgi:hypothetical protein
LFSPWTQTHLPDVYREAIASAPWEISGVVTFKNSSHVNLPEMRGLRKLVRSRSLKGAVSRRIVTLTDSRIVLGAYGKCRSSSGQLNSIQRSMLGYTVLRKLQVRAC